MATVSRPRTSEAFVSGADVVVESLIRHGVDVLFAYPGGASMPLHQALTRAADRLRTILPRHEQGGGFDWFGVYHFAGQVQYVPNRSLICTPGSTHAHPLRC